MEPKPVITPTEPAARKKSFSEVLRQPVSLKKKTIKYPTKTTMNLNLIQQDKARLYKMVPLYVLLGLVVVAAAKFGVIDRYQAVADARGELAAYQQQVADMDEKLKDFAQVQEKYQRYTKNYQTPEEATLIDRLALVEMINQSADSLVNISSIAVAKEVVTIQVTADTLTTIAQYKAKLQQSDMVRAASVFNADTVDEEDTGTQKVNASIVVTLDQEVIDE